MALNRIEDAERLNKGVTGLSDTPNMEASALQAKFDELGNMAIDAYNETVDTLNSENGALNIAATVPEGLNASPNTQSILNALARRSIHSEDLMHSHDNKSVLDTITASVKAGYDNIVGIFGNISRVTQSVTDNVGEIPSGHAVVNYVGRMGGGDMQRVTYDADNDGVVDNAAALGGHPETYFATQEALDGKLDGNGLVTDYDVVAEGGSDEDVPSTSLIHQMIVNFTDGVDRIYAKVLSNGSTPESHALDDVANAIDNIRADGNAMAPDVAAGKVFWSGKIKRTGIMKTKIAANYIPTTVDQVIDAGQYLDGRQVIKGDKNLISGNIKSGVTIFDVPGNENVVNTFDGDATAGQILAGKKAFVKGEEIVGTIASKGATTYTPGTASQEIAAGQYLSGKQTIKGDANLVPGNIKKDTSIFGIAGSDTVVDTADADAADIDIFAGKTAYINGEKVTGAMPVIEDGTTVIEPGDTYTISEGYHDGNGIVKARNSEMKIVYVGHYNSKSGGPNVQFNVYRFVNEGCELDNFVFQNLQVKTSYSGTTSSYYGNNKVTMTLVNGMLSITPYITGGKDSEGSFRNQWIEADIYAYYVDRTGE